jgi:hypothetical protein
VTCSMMSVPLAAASLLALMGLVVSDLPAVGPGNTHQVQLAAQVGGKPSSQEQRRQLPCTIGSTAKEHPLQHCTGTV